MILRQAGRSLGSAVLRVKFASTFVDVTGLPKITVLRRLAKLNWQKLNI